MPESSVENPINNGDITAIIVKGYKAIAEEITMEIAPLTILAGANSSGKSSVMQPLLLMKQTLQATYDPGALLLNGPHVKFTSAKQLFNKHNDRQVNEFSIGFQIHNTGKLIYTFSQTNGKPIDLSWIEFGNTNLTKIKRNEIVLENEQDRGKILHKLSQFRFAPKDSSIDPNVNFDEGESISFAFNRVRCFLEGKISVANTQGRIVKFVQLLQFVNPFSRKIHGIIHIPALRGNPERAYQVTAVGQEFP
ncbi:AAA family ATPase, partial [Chamaesiphon sp. VAR_69_metabat_338]|uniref:AAA family ATPase n=1 Tax=Chamaesiphon sp. VAR_69_metabat_338 TaxID=2964704 RepID=UPI00286E96E7